MPKSDTSPRRLITFDTETRWRDVNGRTVHSLRLWVARCRELVTVDGQLAGQFTASGTTCAGLAEWIDKRALRDHSTWVFAHNLHFDLAVSDLIVQLCRRGYSLTDHALTNTTVWARLHRGNHRLVIADSHSWLGLKLDAIAKLLGTRKLRLPDNDDSDAAWLARCERDVDVLETAMLQLIEWWRESSLGPWGVTGTACGWSAARRLSPRSMVLIDPDPKRRALERRAISGGRRDCWRVGELPRSRYAEIDLQLAHLTACQHFALPSRPLRAFTSLPVDGAELWDRFAGIIAECEVETQSPRYPLIEAGRVWYPVGRFRTVLAGPELHAARERGELRAIGPGMRYRLAHHMRAWAQWCRDLIDNADGATPPLVQVLAKTWSRTVPGKWAGHTSEVIDKREGWCQTWLVERGCHYPSGHKCAILQIGGQEWTMLTDLDADECFPAVLAWVQSLTRVALNRMIEWFGSELTIVCNTDAVIVRAERGLALGRLADAITPFVPVVKGAWHDLTVLSPQHLIVDGERRFAGVPTTAHPSSPTTMEWTVWPRLTKSMERGYPGQLAQSSRQADYGAVPLARWVLADGRTMPLRAAVGGLGGPQLLPPDQSLTTPPLGPLAASQHPYLRNLISHNLNVDHAA